MVSNVLIFTPGEMIQLYRLIIFKGVGSTTSLPFLEALSAHLLRLPDDTTSDRILQVLGTSEVEFCGVVCRECVPSQELLKANIVK